MIHGAAFVDLQDHVRESFRVASLKKVIFVYMRIHNRLRVYARAYVLAPSISMPAKKRIHAC